jgi:hypothetical protein
MTFKILWDNGHACGTLSGTYDNEADAEAAGEDWLREMIAIDDDPAAAEEAYSYEVIEAAAVEPPDEGCRYCAENRSHTSELCKRSGGEG